MHRDDGGQTVEISNRFILYGQHHLYIDQWKIYEG